MTVAFSLAAHKRLPDFAFSLGIQGSTWCCELILPLVWCSTASTVAPYIGWRYWQDWLIIASLQHLVESNCWSKQPCTGRSCLLRWFPRRRQFPSSVLNVTRKCIHTELQRQKKGRTRRLCLLHVVIYFTRVACDPCMKVQGAQFAMSHCSC